MLGPLRAWAGIANIGQDLDKEILQGTSEVESNGDELPRLFHQGLERSHLSCTEDFIILKLEFSDEIFSPTLCINAISFDYVFLQPKQLRNVLIQF